MRRWFPFVIPFAFVFSAGMVAWAISQGAFEPDRSDQVRWVPFADLDPTVPWVRTAGMAHYEVVVQQHVPAALFRDAETYYLYGLFEPYDSDSRMIQVMVRSKYAPDSMASFELMTLEGKLTRATPDKVGYDVEISLGKRSDYFFADDMLLLEPFDVQSGLDPRAAPNDPDTEDSEDDSEGDHSEPADEDPEAP